MYHVQAQYYDPATGRFTGQAAHRSVILLAQTSDFPTQSQRKTMMSQLEPEWYFKFRMRSNLSQREHALLGNEITLLAERWTLDRQFDSGAGFQMDPRSLTSESAHSFGIFPIDSSRLISFDEANELWRVLNEWAENKGLNLIGGFRPFTKDERDPNKPDVRPSRFS